MRSFLELVVVVFIGLGVGGSLSWYSIQTNQGFGALKIGQWTAWPLAGSLEADPYTTAKVAAEGEVPLGAAEGLAFHAREDENGQLLRRECQYQLIGKTPPARFWTLAAHSEDGEMLSERPSENKSLLSPEILRNADGSFALQVGPKLASGNWLRLTGTGPYQLILRMYDSPITSTSGIVDPEMPSINRLECAS